MKEKISSVLIAAYNKNKNENDNETKNSVTSPPFQRVLLINRRKNVTQTPIVIRKVIQCSGTLPEIRTQF